MAFEISPPIQFLPQPTLMKGDIYGAMDFAHHKQQQQQQQRQNSSSAYPSAYNNGTTDKPSSGAEGLYVDFAPSSPSYYHDPPPAIPVSASLVASHTQSNQYGSYSTNLNTTISPLSSSPPLRKKDTDYYLQQQQNGLLSPLPTNTSMYESHFEQNSGAGIKVPTPPITDMVHPQSYMVWKQGLYSPPLAATVTSWTQSQQEEEVFGPTTPTRRSLSGSPSLQDRNSMVSNNMPPCNCIPMVQYDSMYNHPETLSIPYCDSSVMTLASSSSPPPHTGIYSDFANNNNSKIMGYSHRSQQRSSMDQSRQRPSLDLSPSSSSSLSDDYSQHHQQRHSLRSNNGNPTGTNPTTSSSSSSYNTGTTTIPSTASAPRRYKCTVCVKRFTRPSSLATHMHSHTGEKPYKCLIDGCGRRFSVVSNLRRHAKIHLHATSMVGSGRKLHLA